MLHSYCVIATCVMYVRAQCVLSNLMYIILLIVNWLFLIDEPLIALVPPSNFLSIEHHAKRMSS